MDRMSSFSNPKGAGGRSPQTARRDKNRQVAAYAQPLLRFLESSSGDRACMFKLAHIYRALPQRIQPQGGRVNPLLPVNGKSSPCSSGFRDIRNRDDPELSRKGKAVPQSALLDNHSAGHAHYRRA